MTLHRFATSFCRSGPSALLIAVSLAACSGSPTRSDSGVIEDGRLITGVARLDFTVLDVDGRPVNAAAVLVPAIYSYQYNPGASVFFVQSPVSVDSNGRSSNVLERINSPFTVLSPDTLTIPYEVRFDTTKYRLAVPDTITEVVRVHVTFSPPPPARTPAAQPVLIRTSARRR
jgi:hypothetical protein